MNADNFRHLFEYHFIRNREIWDHCVLPLDEKTFKQKLPYSVGSIRNQCVHLLNVDERWFSGLLGEELPGWYRADTFKTHASVREKWDQVEVYMRGYLDALTDEMLIEILDGDLAIWQVLFHVLNHGTDHRAQMLAMLDALGAPTFAQDYFFFTAGLPIKVHEPKPRD